jgi:hypothetical protein
VYEAAVEWTLALRAFWQHCAVGWRVRSPGGRVSNPISKTRDAVYRGLVTAKPFAAQRRGYYQAAAMWATLLRLDQRLRAALESSAPPPEVRLLFRQIFYRYEHGLRTWTPTLGSGPDGKAKPRVAGFPTWYCAFGESGRLEVVSYADFVPEDTDARDFAKVWHGSRLMPVEPLPPWTAMGKLIGAWVIDLNGRRELVIGEPAPPTPGPSSPPAPPKPPVPPPEPVEPELDTIPGDHTFERLEGGTAQQCRYCYRGRRKHGNLPARVVRRAPDDLSKQPPGEA